jgi:hypothetical protein
MFACLHVCILETVTIFFSGLLVVLFLLLFLLLSLLSRVDLELYMPLITAY